MYTMLTNLRSVRKIFLIGMLKHGSFIKVGLFLPLASEVEITFFLPLAS